MTGKKANRGYVIGNSAIAAEAGVNCLFTNVRFNPPYFEYGKNSIVPVGDVFLKVYSKDTELPLSDIEITENTYPRYSARYSFGGTELSVVAFAPISVNDVYDMFPSSEKIPIFWYVKLPEQPIDNFPASPLTSLVTVWYT